jgi:hypothetical protein
MARTQEVNSIRPDGTPVLLDAAAVAFGFDVASFRCAGRLTGLALFEFAFVNFFRANAGALGLEFFHQSFPRRRSVLELGAMFHRFHADAAGPVEQLHTGGNFVDVLPAVARGTHKGFLHILDPETKLFETREKGFGHREDFGFQDSVFSENNARPLLNTENNQQKTFSHERFI